MSDTVTLETIRAAADRLGAAAARSEAIATALREKLNAAVTPIYAQHRPHIDAAAEEQADAERALRALLEAAPNLFAKTPRSLSVNGVKCGYRKGEDSLDWESDDVVIARIRALAKESADMCIRTTESIVAEALAQLPQSKLTALGVRRIPGIDNPFVTIGSTEVDTLVKAILSAAQQRQGEDEKPKSKKGKAKAMGVKEVA